ncbi:MAG: flagellar basal body P-ring formation chaperone FlgA [Halanaerobacter sp.]
MKTRLVVIVSILFLFLSTSVVVKAQENLIRIPSQVEVETLNLRLDEVAEIKGSSKFIEQVKDLSLGQTPAPDYQREIYRDDLVYTLRQEDINLNQIKLQVPYQFNVRADYTPFGVEKLINYGREYIKNELDYESEKIKVEALNAPEELLVPQGEISFEVAKNRNRRLLGVNMLPLKVLVNGELYRKLYLKFETKLEAVVLMPKERLKQGDSLTADLFSREKKLLTKDPGDYVSSTEELKDKVLTRSLSSNQILKRDMLSTPELVERWQEVKIIAEVGGVVVTTQGKALENGRRGDIISVKNTNSDQKIEAKVVASDQVKVVTN